MKNLAKTEPVAVAVAIMVVVSAVVNLLLAFGVDLTDEQTRAITLLADALLGLATIVWVRRRVTPQSPS